ncbi:regulator of G-protein signaling 8 isoform X1 [Larimichthys crocea]|uniref:regulator of G-protein signaling 8 isoform X1 n=1 Tax=Larimichthys crocea TaxID=215358 RepID=UPI0009011EAA|nr:regulator of G-protein signaling 8 isoform X1 [Larimichthys crocea]XP_019128457.1 regulator of G-protein signaling 8 isoform X1 [Larimichthys crocea]
MKTRLGCLSHKSDSYSDFSEFLPPAHETTARCLKLSTDEVVRWSESFDHLLSHKYGLAAFRTFLKTEFSDENIEFWMACEEYKKIKSSTKLVSKANKIFKEFIDIQAPREVNIDYRTRERTKQSLEDPSPTSLNEIQAKVYCLMEKDSYPRFLRSKMYQDMVNRAHAQGQRSSMHAIPLEKTCLGGLHCAVP